MTLAFEFHPEADAEFNADVDWYDDRDFHVGSRFGDAVRSAAESAADSLHVCENPTVVQMVADRWSTGAHLGEADQSPGPVLVCTSGQPSAAVLDLLDVLTSRGAECRYHGDFDWGGLRIAATVAKRVDWTPWRFTAADYARAVDAHDVTSRHLTGSPAASPWDPALVETMARKGFAVEEEAVADVLVDDLLVHHQGS